MGGQDRRAGLVDCVVQRGARQRLDLDDVEPVGSAGEPGAQPGAPLGREHRDDGRGAATPRVGQGGQAGGSDLRDHAVEVVEDRDPVRGRDRVEVGAQALVVLVLRRFEPEHRPRLDGGELAREQRAAATRRSDDERGPSLVAPHRVGKPRERPIASRQPRQRRPRNRLE